MTRKSRFLAVVLVLSAVAELRQAAADVVDLGASQDNTIYSEDELSNGAGPVMFAGRSGFEETRRALIQFDIAGAVPSGSTITSVTLQLFMSRTLDGFNADVELHRVEAAWGEGDSFAGGGGPGSGGGGGAPAEPGDATWTYRITPTDAWTNPGGDFSTTVSASESVGGIDFYIWGSTSQMVNDVQGWLDSPATNFGWIILGNEEAGQTARRFDSRENPTAANRPLLTVEYTPGGSPADFTDDGYVDDEDLDIWEVAYGVDDAGDTDDDGDTDGVDFLRWQIDYTGPPPPELRAVPEPAGPCLLLAGMLVALTQRYRLCIGT